MTHRSRAAVATIAAALTVCQAIAVAAPPLPHGYVLDTRTHAPVRLAFTDAEVTQLADAGVRVFPSTVDRLRPWTRGYLPSGEIVFAPGGLASVIDDRYFSDPARARLWSCVQEGYPAAAGEGVVAIDALVARCMGDVWSRVGDPCLKPAQVPSLCTDLGYHTSWCGRKDRPSSVTKQWACFAPIEQAVSAATEPLTDVAVPMTTYGEGGATTRHAHDTAPGVRVHDRDDYFEWDEYVPFDSAAFAALRGVPGPAAPATAGITPPIGVSSSVIGAVVIAPGVDLANRASYAANGTAVASCAEYAVEKHLEFARLDDWERARARTPMETYRAIYATTEAGGPFVTTAGDFDFRDRAGGLACTGTAATCDFDPTAAVAAGSTRAPLWGAGTPTRTTYRNAYAYARQVLAIDGDAALTAAQRAALYRPLERHYTVDDRWHLRMGAALAGYHPDLLEDLRLAQRAIWAQIVEYEARRDHLATLRASPPCRIGWRPFGVVQFCTTLDKENAAAAELALARTALAAAIVDETLQCPATGPAGETPCDWAPSRAVDSVHAYFEQRIGAAYHQCLDHEGDGPLVEAQLEQPYVHPAAFEPKPLPAGRYPTTTAATACPLAVDWTPTTLTASQAAACATACLIDGPGAMPTSGVTGPNTAACRALFLSTDPRSSPAALEQHWRDQPRYVALLTAALREVYGDRSLEQQTSYGKTIGNSHFGVATSFLTSGGVADPFRRHICDQQPYSEDASTVDVAMFGVSYEMMNSALETNPLEGQAEHVTAGPSAGASAGWDCGGDPTACPLLKTQNLDDDLGSLARDVRVGANFIQNENQQGASISANLPAFSVALGVHATVYLSVGPFMAFIRGGATGAAGVGANLAVTALATRSPTEGCRGFDFSTRFAVTGYANIGAQVAAGVSLGIPGFSVDAGIRGALTLFDASLGTSLAAEVKSGHSVESEPTALAQFTFGVDVSGHVFSGSLSLFIEMTIAFITIPLYEVVLAQWKGPGITYTGAASLGTDGATSSGEGRVDECLLNSLQVIWKEVAYKTNGCPCYLWDGYAEGAACGAP